MRLGFVGCTLDRRVELHRDGVFSGEVGVEFSMVRRDEIG